MTGKGGRYAVLILTALVGASVAALPLTARPPAALPPSSNPNIIAVKPLGNVQDVQAEKTGGLWVLDFKFMAPRIKMINVPGRGLQRCWYLWYEVSNNTGAPRTFVPDFQLLPNDGSPALKDEILPSVQRAIEEEEGGGRKGYTVKNTVTIASEPIPPNMPKATPRVVRGVATWTDPNEPNASDDDDTKAKKKKLPKLADASGFTIFVGGLSNGWAVTDAVAEGGKPVVHRKTLQLNFKVRGDRFGRKSEDVQFLGFEWFYKASTMTLPDLPGAVKPEK